ncbi:hypothetical protein HPB52_006651 [Rhipicephalus sanguineus]|uniref:CSD domain-containing protein n=1 Tax=Rhipicephalus sanguineus TaxID=34632 RepID=A0A9D4T732_RHISA|nr:hypothetical protein HPB52_006651 [Rhipicephalus sanguineus]
MPGPPVRRAERAESNRAATSLSNLRGRVSVVKEGYGFIQVERPERASVYVHRSTIVNPRPKDSRNFGLQEGDRVILDIKESPPQFKARYQAVRVQLEDTDADAALNSSPSVPASVPKETEKTEKEVVNQVGTICSVNENGGTLRFGAGNEEFVVFDRRCVPNTLLKPTEKVSEIFSVGNKVGFNARLANTGAGAAQWQATLVTTVLRGNTSQVFVFDTEPLTRSTRHDSKKDFGNELTRRSSGATESPEEEDRPATVPQRCKPRWAFDIARSSTKLDTAAPAGGHPIPAGTDQPPKITPFEKTPRQYIPLATNSHGTDSSSTTVKQQAPRSGDRPPTTSGDRRPTTTTGDRLPTAAGDHKRPATAISVERVTCQHCGAGEDEQGLAEAIAEMVTSCLRSVIREEVQALRHEFLGPTGITAGAGDMSSSGHQGLSQNAPKVFIQSRKTPLQAVQGRDAATDLLHGYARLPAHEVYRPKPSFVLDNTDLLQCTKKALTNNNTGAAAFQFCAAEGMELGRCELFIDNTPKLRTRLADNCDVYFRGDPADLGIAHGGAAKTGLAGGLSWILVSVVLRELTHLLMDC